MPSDYCCICGQATPSYNNPEPVRSSSLDCCDSCNRLVIKARRKYWKVPVQEREAYVERLWAMNLHELTEELEKDQEP